MLSCEWDLATFYQWLTVIVILFCLTAAQIAVMITNGRSDDQVDAAAGAVADNGISLFAVGECRARAVADFPPPPPLQKPPFKFFFIRALSGLSWIRGLFVSMCERLLCVCCFFFPPCAGVHAIAQISERANVAAICVRVQSLILSFAWARHFLLPPRPSWILAAVYPQVYLHISSVASLENTENLLLSAGSGAIITAH